MTIHKNRTSVGIGKFSCHFSASHIILTSEIVEGIHGHNYYVELELLGDIGRDDLLYDFIFMDGLLEKIVSEWDHFLLLPKNNEGITYKEKSDNLEFAYQDRLYSIPLTDVKLLDCRNTSAETLARLISQKISSHLPEDETKDAISTIKITVWETPHYYATYCLYL